VPPQSTLARPDGRGRLDGSNKNDMDVAEKCSSYFHPNAQPRGPTTSSGEQNLDGEPSWYGRGSAGPDVKVEHCNPARCSQV